MAYKYARLRGPQRLNETNREKARKGFDCLGLCRESEKMERIDEMEPEFPAFPYKPYSIQFDFMKALYKFLNKGGISMLESPTGLCYSFFLCV